VPTPPVHTRPAFDRAEYLRLNEKCARETGDRLVAETAAASRRITAAEEALRVAQYALTRAQDAWTAASKAEENYIAQMNGPVVDVIENSTGKVVGTGHVTGKAGAGEWFGIDHRASYRRSCYTIVPVNA
jgi:hypothetical protein